MTAPSWPPEDHHPIEKWSDHELIDQYRYVQGELADEDPETDDGPLNALVEEIARRGLGFLADDIEADPSSAGRENEIETSTDIQN
jgi:hypothetical protein